MTTNTITPNGNYQSDVRYQPIGTYQAAQPAQATQPGGYQHDTFEYGMGGRALQPQAPRATAPSDSDEMSEGALAQVRYWVGTGLTAVIAALTGLVGLIVAQGILGIHVMLGTGSGVTPVSVSEYGLAAAGIALLASALFAGMIRVAPKPVAYYTWLVGMVTVLAVLLPFTTTVALHAQIALALINLAVGLVVMLGIPLAASNARS